MSRLEISALKRLTNKPETQSQAVVLLNAAKLKTGPGTGFVLGEGATGLPAICAYLASEQCVFTFEHCLTVILTVSD